MKHRRILISGIVLAVVGFTYWKVVGPVLGDMTFTESYPPLLRSLWFPFWGKILFIVGVVIVLWVLACSIRAGYKYSRYPRIQKEEP